MKSKLAGLIIGTAFISHFTMADIPSYEIINESQFGTGENKERITLRFSDGAILAIESCADYLSALQAHGRAKEFSGIREEIRVAEFNLPLCEIRRYLDTHNLHDIPSDIVITPDNLPAKAYWALSRESQEFIKNQPEKASLAEVEPSLRKTGNNKYSSEGINYYLTNLGQIAPDKFIVQVSNNSEGGTISGARLFILSNKQTPWSVQEDFSLLSE